MQKRQARRTITGEINRALEHERGNDGVTHPHQNVSWAGHDGTVLRPATNITGFGHPAMLNLGSATAASREKAATSGLRHDLTIDRG